MRSLICSFVACAVNPPCNLIQAGADPSKLCVGRQEWAVFAILGFCEIVYAKRMLLGQYLIVRR